VRAPRHGELQAAKNPEAYKIWLTRNNELELLEPICYSKEFLEPDPFVQDLGSRFMNLLNEICTPLQIEIIRRRIDGETLEDIAKTNGVTRERIRQIEGKALRQLRYKCRKLDEDICSRVLDYKPPKPAWIKEHDLYRELDEKYQEAVYAAPDDSWIVCKTEKGYEIFYWTANPNLESNNAKWNNSNRGPFSSCAEATAFVANFKN